MLPNFLLFPVRWNRDCLLQIAIRDVLTELLRFLDDKVDNAALFFFEDGSSRDFLEDLQKLLAQGWELRELPNVAPLVILDNWNFMLFEEIESSVRRNASVRAIDFDNCVEVDGYIGVLHEMLEIWIAAVLADHCLAR